eukprot:TRINITY_DN10144_c0_g1_i3.p1 TRINITY_DN10144_c0_g1~~TRINITY_DN10144_c0_g1_i3.p1  ORF type:complete len:212 (-),score=29.73 TRINITY_DN10144_c0_g1_i3:83-718(-)
MADLRKRIQGGDSAQRRVRVRPTRERTPYDRTTQKPRGSASSRHMAGASLTEICQAEPQHRVLKVSAGSDPKSVAGAIAHTVREAGAPPTLLAAGPSSINQAIKAVAIARDYLADDTEIDLIAQPEFAGETDRATIHLRRAKPIDGSDSTIELMVKPGSDPYKVAGAIKGRVREGERVSVVAVGPAAVFHAVEAGVVGLSLIHISEPTRPY